MAGKKVVKTMTADKEPDKLDAVFEGGGVKGISLVGALHAFEEAGYQWQNLAGASAGSIIAALLAVGYQATELKEVMLSRIRLADFMDSTGLGPGLSLLIHKGLYRGDHFLKVMRDLIAEKTDKERLTFKDLIIPPQPGDSPRDYESKYKYKLRVIASDISCGRLLVLPQDAIHMGLEPDELEVALAVRMSGSFPFFFKPVVQPEPADPDRRHWIMDGGMLSNFPVWLFDAPLGVTPAWPTIGFLLDEPEETEHRPIKGFVSLLRAIAATVTSAHDRKALDSFNRQRIIRIPTGPFSTLDFDIDRAGQEWLYDSGYRAARTFLEGFQMSDYRKQRLQYGKLVKSGMVQAVS